MQSPVASVTLQHADLPGGLHALQCPTSGGVWVRPAVYWTWLERHEPADIAPDAGEAAGDSDTPAGKVCPEDGGFLTRKPVGADQPFHVDRCHRCGGFWLDAGEWEALLAAGLAESMHLIHSAGWQARQRERQQREQAEKRLREALGEDDAARVETFAAWLDRHPHRQAILGRLTREP